MAAYAAFLLVCAELSAKLLLLTPWIRARLPPDLEASWRARWVGRYVFERRPIFYSFDVHDPLTGWTLRPGLRGFRQFPGSTVDSNSRGVRGRAEHAPGRQPGLRRVVVLGDSFTFGEGVGDAEAWPFLLQGHLGPAVEVVNLGVHGFGHDQMLLRLQRDGLAYAPDLVLLGFVADDVPRNLLAFRDYAKPRFVFGSAGELALTGTPVAPPRRTLLREALRPHLLDVARIVRARGRRQPTFTPEGELMMAALLDAMRREAEAAGARFAILDLPPQSELPGTQEVGASEAPLLAYASGRGVAVGRTRPELRRRLQAGAAYRMTGHYDAALHRDVAAIAAGWISAAGLLRPAPAAAR